MPLPPRFPSPSPPKDFGRRNPRPVIEPPPVVLHAPQGLERDTPPHDRRRLRSVAVFLGVFGLATVGGVAMVEAIRAANQCKKADPDDWNAPDCRSGGHGGGWGSYGWGGGSYSSGSRSSASFGGFGATGEGGAHGGGHGGGGE